VKAFFAFTFAVPNRQNTQNLSPPPVFQTALTNLYACRRPFVPALAYTGALSSKVRINFMYKGERFNAYSHLIGTMLAVTGMVLLTVKAAVNFDPYKLAGALTYGICLILLYLGSTLYHSIPQPKAKAVLQKIDHCMIYLLIAGSYTPFTLVTLKGGWGWSLFGVSWGLALFGITQELTIGRKSEKRRLSMALYVIMGWLILVAMYPLAKILSAAGLFWLALGGILYSAGIYWFVNDMKIKHGHGIWHLFVLGGSLAQFVCIYFYVI
jgi:channel protein, hemolysin III family